MELTEEIKLLNNNRIILEDEIKLTKYVTYTMPS